MVPEDGSRMESRTCMTAAKVFARSLAVACLAVLAACATDGLAPWAGTPDGLPVVERIDPDTARIHWPASYAKGPLAVYAGTAPSRIDRSVPIAWSDRGERSVTIRGLDRRSRYYFQLVPTSGAETQVVATRRLALDGTDNFRDLGGYETSDGRRVRWGLLYRSNDLSQLTSRDLEYLSGLGVRLVCDFRSEGERTRQPDRTPTSPAPDFAFLPVSVVGVDPVAMREKIRTGKLSARGLDRVMTAAYRSFVTDFADEYAAMFRRISKPGMLPTILHCTAGKDRAGFAAALALLALGVPEETVFEDYLLTNTYRADYNRFILRVVPIFSLFRTSREELAPLLEARPGYLRAALDAIDANYGSLDRYLEDGLGVTPADRERMRAIFLEDAPDALETRSAALQGP